ncbi:proline iminopeptidase [Streptomyces spiroverticillatus]|uniref:Proline iminopeptidase n=1 Tax=Streptomyces finlayi TaxID=67296 RepID=A0A919CDY7_9ACTN|nr:prolyl aminopeptidase [Streptomyces finlayi]GHA29270.1 proline iminopeptidase [Streptomyces spiroverticillatus]GHD09757.1 proline iminopeptidase [Streptomyces finlayi]
MPAPYPILDPYDQGLLDVGDGNRIHWEVSGNPDGKPALVVHGGPGSGSSPRNRKHFDPDRYRLILFDQRGCGRSTPHVADPATSLEHNTTAHLIADMDKLRQHLGVERWLLFGGSWGSTLVLAYAQAFPERVSEVVLAGVTTTRRSEIAWLYGGAGRFFPEAHARFREQIPEAERDDLVAAYARRASSADLAVRDKAVADWCAWEDAVLGLEPVRPSTAPYAGRPEAGRISLVRIASHYFAHGAWLEEGELVRGAGKLAGIPGVLLQGRHDLGGPPHTAWELAQAWPGAELRIFDDSGHMGGTGMGEAMAEALERFAGK